MENFIHLADIFRFRIFHRTFVSEIRLETQSIFCRPPKLLLTLLLTGFTISTQASESNVLQRNVCMSSDGEEGTGTGHFGSPPRTPGFRAFLNTCVGWLPFVEEV
jgi:hypothetical protein